MAMNLEQAESPASSAAPKYHTGKLPNSKVADGKPRLLLMGQRRSGKSSISSVVFHKLPPSETLYLETTTKIRKDSMHSFMDFQVWDFPGHLNYFDPAFDSAEIFSEIGALIWVIDAQDEYLDAVARLNATILNLQTTYPAINIEVFVHKVDGLSDDYRSDTFRDIVQRVQDELSDAGVDSAPVHFHQTSIYDHSIFEAFSKVIQKLIPQLPTLEALLNSLCFNCRFQKAYLFDLVSKIYIATDTSPTDIGSYEICSDYIDVILDITEIYGQRPVDTGQLEGTEQDQEGSQAVNKANGSDSPNSAGILQESGNGPAESLITMEKKGNYLYLREVNTYLCLICIMGDNSPTEGKALIDYNVGVFQEALRQVFPR
ncbi:hypothetical protein, variant [Verruconis gallopava]|uniref:GTP-binding protein n=1 Tax=Verruconis gallopava TaxID=253628 RepID=A0A0D1XQA0_9PEZI|nr:hypothetical protein, variant [Verruconis gallopava]KIW04776.1 hypothetical protein, variant [Verruconis gallopava]